MNGQINKSSHFIPTSTLSVRFSNVPILQRRLMLKEAKYLVELGQDMT